MPAVLTTIKEDLLQFIWEQQLFDRHALRTTDGKPVEVIKPGRLQSNSGPDLSDARVRIGGQIWAGTIEVHVRSSEWYAHGHEKDPAYDNVVLHVVMLHDMAVRTARGGRVPTVEIGPRIAPQGLATYERLMKGRAWVPCADMIAHVDPQRIGPWLERVMVERLERKTTEVEALYVQLDRDGAATFYHMLLRALGMKVNAEPFGMLALALPLNILLKYRDDLFRTEALLFGQAGLLQVDFVDDHPRNLQHEHALLSSLHQLKPVPVAAWKFARLHPPSFPTVRVAQLARLIACGDGAFGHLLGTNEVRAIVAGLDVTADGYWMDHFRFDQPSVQSPKHLGRSMAEHVIINAIVPFRFAMACMTGDEVGRQQALELLEGIPPERNGIIDQWSSLGLMADSAARSQALIELKNQYCAGRKCLTCGIGVELMKRDLPSRTRPIR
mgnify:CR=1 FL=1